MPLTLRSMHWSPDNWRCCFTDPIPLCLRFRGPENPICVICLNHFGPLEEEVRIPPALLEAESK